MAIWDSVIAQDAQFTFCDADALGAEDVILIFANGTTNRTVKAQVERGGLANRVEVDQGIDAVLIVCLQNHATRGLAQTEWDQNVKCRITNPYPGVTTFDFKLPPWSSADAGMLVFRINRQ